MVVRFMGATSSERNMDGGSPQGTPLGVICFLLQMNGMKAVPTLPFEEILVPPGIQQKSIACKFIDDLSVASAIKLKESLQKDSDLSKPLVYHSRTEHVLPTEKNPMIPQLEHITNFAK